MLVNYCYWPRPRPIAVITAIPIGLGLLDASKLDARSIGYYAFNRPRPIGCVVSNRPRPYVVVIEML